MNPKKRSDFAVSKLSYEGFFKDIRHLKEVMLATFPDDFNVDGQIGYIQPGHGAKGRQLWISSNADVQQMYAQCDGKKEILLWFLKSEITVDNSASEPKSKRPCPDTSGASKADSISHTLSEVDKIVATLTEKHSKKYTVEQIRAWAHMIQIGKHESYDEPPNKPFFKTKEGKGSNQTLSPKKRIELRSECMDQLQKWRELLDKDIISKEQYGELQGKILKDIKEL